MFTQRLSSALQSCHCLKIHDNQCGKDLLPANTTPWTPGLENTVSTFCWERYWPLAEFCALVSSRSKSTCWIMLLVGLTGQWASREYTPSPAEVTATLSSYYVGTLGAKLRCPCLESKLFTHWAISTPLFFNVISHCVKHVPPWEWVDLIHTCVFR